MGVIMVGKHYAAHETHHGLMLLNIHDRGVALELPTSSSTGFLAKGYKVIGLVR